MREVNALSGGAEPVMNTNLAVGLLHCRMRRGNAAAASGSVHAKAASSIVASLPPSINSPENFFTTGVSPKSGVVGAYDNTGNFSTSLGKGDKAKYPAAHGSTDRVSEFESLIEALTLWW